MSQVAQDRFSMEKADEINVLDEGEVLFTLKKEDWEASKVGTAEEWFHRGVSIYMLC